MATKCTWSDEDIHKLLAIWKDQQQQYTSMNNKKLLFQEWSKKLDAEGVTKTAEQIKSKTKNLKFEFRAQKPGPSGGSPSTWKFYSTMSEILKTSHYYNSELAFVTETTEAPNPENEVQSEATEERAKEFENRVTTPIRGTKRKRKEDTVLDILTRIEKTHKDAQASLIETQKKADMEFISLAQEMKEFMQAILPTFTNQQEICNSNVTTPNTRKKPRSQ